MKNKYLLILLIVFSQALYSQWVSNYFGNNSHNSPLTNASGTAIAVDGPSYCYVTGFSDEMLGSGKDILVIKYDNASGDTVWVRTLNGPGNGDDEGFKVTSDTYHNVYVAGRINNSPNFNAPVLAKFDSQGTLQWSRSFYLDSLHADGNATGIAVDNNNNIYITGYCTNSDSIEVIITLKYNSEGDLLWHEVLCPDGLESRGVDLKLSSNGSKIFVLANATHASTGLDIALICYNSQNGNDLFVSYYSGPGNGEDKAFGIVVDETDKLYITGYSAANNAGNFDCVTLKYSGNGSLLWDNLYNGDGNGEDKAFGIAVDEDGFVYAAGSTTSIAGDKNYLVLAYNSEGNPVWPAKTYNGPAGGDDIAGAIAVAKNPDNTKSLIVTGASWSTNNNNDFATIRFDAATGEVQTVDRYTMNAQTEDIAKAIAVDSNNNAYITGLSQLLYSGPSGQSAATTLKMQTYGGNSLRMSQVPAVCRLYQNYPNPFNPSTTIKFEISRGSRVKLTVYDLIGRAVLVLADQYMNPGSYEMKFTFSNLASGIYFYELRAGDLRDVKKMTLIK